MGMKTRSGVPLQSYYASKDGDGELPGEVPLHPRPAVQSEYPRELDFSGNCPAKATAHVPTSKFDTCLSTVKPAST